MKEITVDTKKIVNINETVLYYVIVSNGKEKAIIKTTKEAYAEVNKLIGKKEVKAESV